MTTPVLERPGTTSGSRQPDAVVIPAHRTRPAWKLRLLRVLVRSLRVTEGRVAFVLSAAAYLAVAVWLTLRHGIIAVDGISRTANAMYVVLSRQPHLAAVGFVWNPLPSLVEIPLLPFRHFWPQLTSLGFAGDICSALWMAGAVAVLLGILRDFGVSRPVRWALTALFAVDPMVAFYGACGMSEASMLFTLLLSTRMFARWLRTGRPADLVLTGIALGLAYMVRYEALAPGATIVGFVLVVAFLRARGSLRTRVRPAIVDGFLVGAPFAFSVALWAVTSEVIVHEWFPTISSSYGNSAQVEAAAGSVRAATGQGTPAAVTYLLHQIVGLEPLVLVAAAVAVFLAIISRDNRALAPIAVMGSVMAFDAVAFLSGHSFGWLRFQITVIPMTVLLAGCIPASRLRKPTRRPRYAALSALLLSGRLLVNAVLALVAIGLVAPSLPTTMQTMLDHRLGREESHQLTALLDPKHARDLDATALDAYHVERSIAASVAAMHLPDGSVITDSGNAFAVLAAAPDLRTYVITSDLDFQQVLADPVRFGVHYVLIPKGAYFDAIESEYPGLYATGDGAQLVKEWKGTGYTPDWRLYYITDATQLSNSAAVGAGQG